ncbi:MAG: sulfatase-like hydrolase/transferase [Planctomycetota bacterium]|nr:sulfatase-like hydrolase/transferase [Planctomycetota bacterium]
MKKHRWLGFHVGMVLSCFLCAYGWGEETTAAREESAQRPNILWISLEDISPDLGCYGDAYAITPNIDRLARQGALFTNAFSHSGVCAPTRSGVITGMYPTSIGTQHMRANGVPPDYVRCFTEYLRRAGYYCTNDSKTDYQFAAPVTAWDDNRRGAHWRNRPDDETPFFCVINLTSTHESRIRQPEAAYQRLRSSLPPDKRHDPDQAKVPPYYPDTPVTRRDWARYADLITATDRRVGKILRDLKQDGLTDQTVVFFWGDHGRGLPRAKRWIYDSGIRVPLVVRWPGRVAPNTRRDDMVCFLDLAPTVLSLAGVTVPQHMQGQVILGSERAQEREFIFAARDRMDEARDIIRAVRDKRFKYIRNFMPELPYAQSIDYMDQMPTMREMRRLHAAGDLDDTQELFFRSTKPVEELYDTQADPHEIRNLAADPQFQDQLQRMRKTLDSWARDTGDLGLIPEPILDEVARPEGRWKTTEQPQITVQDGRIAMSCRTKGASIAYAIGAGQRGWKLYTGPIAFSPNTRLRVKACRLGYRDSPVVQKVVP